MKRMLVTVALIICMTLLCGCVGKMSQDYIEAESLTDKMFMRISRENCGQVIVDKETNVMYWMSEGLNNYGTLTLLVNPDGTPRIWEAR